MDYLNEIFYRVWFPKDTQEITIIGATNFEDFIRAEADYRNYALIDGMGDRDAIFNVGLLLSRNYPKARIHLELSHYTEIIKNYNFKKNLVIIGGPGGKYYFDAEIKKEIEDFGNHTCRKFIELGFKYENPSKISYTEDCENLICEDQLYTSTFDDIKIGENKISKAIKVDYGYFSAFPNYLDPAKFRVVMIHGIHTLGVLGATKIFDDDNDIDTLNNFKVLNNKINNSNFSFETFFKVLVDGYSVLNPKVEFNKIFPLGNIDIPKESPKTVFLSHSSKDRDQTLKIKIGLEEIGISAFIAPWDMEAGDWRPQIKTKIKHEKLKILVVVLTKDSQESEVVRYEIETALDEGKEIIAYQSEDFAIKRSFGSLINGKHNILAYKNLYPNPIQELINKVKGHLDKST